MAVEPQMTVAQLQLYADAWNAHNINIIMDFMTTDCVFETSSGAERYGTRFVGYDAVRARFIEVWTDFHDVRFANAVHFVQGNRGCSQWTSMATLPDGSELEMDGCDLFTFVDGRIAVKNSLVKDRD